MRWRGMSGRSMPAMARTPTDEEALITADAAEMLLRIYATPLRIAVPAGSTIGDEAHVLAVVIERRTGTANARSRALQQVANAWAAIRRLREAANGGHYADGISARIKDAERETDGVRVAMVKVRSL